MTTGLACMTQNTKTGLYCNNRHGLYGTKYTKQVYTMTTGMACMAQNTSTKNRSVL